jgi:tRNA(Ile)-lysidine synthase
MQPPGSPHHAAGREVHAFRERVQAALAAHAGIEPGQGVLVAYSGGGDSTALLHVLHSLGYRVTAGHVQHGLRGEDGEADARHAAAFAQALGCPYLERHADVPALAKARRLSLETAAREARYALLDEMATELGLERIATGHTLDDQAETVLLHLLRGSGAAGLAGIPPRRGRLIRPLLGLTHAEALAYCTAEGLTYRTDASNEDARFARNRLRHEVLPLLRQVQPNVSPALARLAEIMREENAFLTSLVAEHLRTLVTWQEGEARLPLAEVAALPLALQRRLLRAVLAAAKGDETDLEFERIEAVVGLIAHGETGGLVELPAGLQAVRGYGELRIGRGEDLPPPHGEWSLPIPGSLTLPDLNFGLVVEESRDLTLSDDPSTAVLDAQGLSGAFTLRTWRPGDRFQPLGMAEPMKLQDFFVNAKAPRAGRSWVPIVEHGGEIVWVVGYRIGERHKVTPGTQRTLRLRAFHLEPEVGEQA